MTASPAFDLKANQPDIGTIPKKQRVTEEEYWAKYYHYPEITYEWNEGELEEKGVSDVITVVMYKWFLELLEHYLRTHPIAQSMVLEMGFSLALPQKKEVRRPDLGVVKNDNPIPLESTDKSYQGTYDLCVEALSDSKPQDIKRDTLDKWQKYAQGGVKEYYILDGLDRYTAFYWLNQKGIYVPIKPKTGGIIQSTVLPGFQFRLSDLSERPSPDEMIDDAVYQGFVLPGYSEAKQPAHEAKQQAETEKEARQQAEQLAEVEKKARQAAEQQAEVEKQARQAAEKQTQQLVDKLRSLGINPDELFKKE